MTISSLFCFVKMYITRIFSFFYYISKYISVLEVYAHLKLLKFYSAYTRTEMQKQLIAVLIKLSQLVGKV